MYKHVDIYLDESGDLGFDSIGASRYFVVAVMATTDTIDLNRLVKRGNRKFNQNEKGAIEFKFNKSCDKVKRHFLRGVACSNSWIAWTAIEKKNAMLALRNEKDRLYHYVCGIALAEVFRSTPSKEIHVILDKRQRKRTVKNDFNRHIESKADECHTGYFSPILKISHFDSTNCEGLQVHDFVVGAIFRNIERDDSRYYDLIKERIIAGKILW